MSKRILLGLFAVLVSVAAALPAGAKLNVGVASVNVTPDPLLPVSGGVPSPG